MTVEQNKATVREFFETSNREGFRKAVSTLADDCQWWTPMGTNGKQEMIGVAEGLEAMLEAPIRFETGTMTAEDDRVAIELKSFGRRKTGVQYANVYHMLFTVRDGGIVEVREHCDTAHAAEVWADLMG